MADETGAIEKDEKTTETTEKSEKPDKAEKNNKKKKNGKNGKVKVKKIQRKNGSKTKTKTESESKKEKTDKKKVKKSKVKTKKSTATVVKKVAANGNPYREGSKKAHLFNLLRGTKKPLTLDQIRKQMKKDGHATANTVISAWLSRMRQLSGIVVKSVKEEGNPTAYRIAGKKKKS